MMLRLFLLAALIIALVGLGSAYTRVTGDHASSNPSPPATALAPRPSAPIPAGTARIELSEAQVNGLLRTGLGDLGYAVDDLYVQLQDGRFVATTSQQVGLFRVPVKIVGEAAIVSGQLVARPISVTAAGLGVPKETVDQIAGNLGRAISDEIASLAVQPTSLQILPGRLVVTGKAK